MIRRLIGLLFIIILLVIGVVDTLAFRFFWYWQYWWLDMIMHGLAGLAMGLFLVFVWRSLWEKVESGLRRRVWITPLATMTIAFGLGIVWEGYELGVFMFLGDYGFDALERIISIRGYDTASDLYFDTLGGLSAGLLTEYLSPWQRK